MSRNGISRVLSAAALVSLSACARADVAEMLPRIALPDGFSVSVFADGLSNARSMVLTPNGTLFVGTRSANYVYAVQDTDGDNKADVTHTILAPGKLPDGSDVWMPNGVAFKEGSLYVATVSQILRFDNIESRLENPPAPVIVTADYPARGHHGWKFIAFGPDDKLYGPVGATCNVCEEEEIFASITRIDPDGTNREIIAHGVRNSVGFDWHPETGELWFTENGRDMMGDDMPGDEITRIAKPGQNLGFLYVQQGDTHDPRF